MRAASAKPATTATTSSPSIHLGTSRLFTSGTLLGAHNSRWLYALLPWPPAWSSAAIASAP